MKYKKIITSLHYNRPNYTRRCISHLESCLGIENYLVIFLIDLSDKLDKIYDIIYNCKLNAIITTNDKKLGGCKSQAKLLNIAFEHGGEYIIHVQDDIILSIDALRMFEYCGTKCANNDNIVCVTAWNNRADVPNKEEMYKLRVKCRSPFGGIAFWKHKIENIGWINSDYIGKMEGSDRLFRQIMKKRNTYSVYPLVSRSNHIGFNQGLNIDLHNENNKYKRYPASLYWADNLLADNYGEFTIEC
jgi:hypothetical protein